ncbi:MAG: NUDIX hydrolase [Polyangiaceae bacterium]|jgi:8-oxo-dGTP pyrophosphatase MutT (NUDIX family)|nr:NUDIX hydrolase [Polyangiaceae bacterium]
MTSEPLAVAAVLARDDGRYLLVRRAAGRPAAGYWTPVTGRPEPGETLEEALAREVLEEVGLTVQVGAEIYRCPTEGAPYLLVWFSARAAPRPDASVRLDPREVAEARWLLPREALELEPMFEATRVFFRGLAG